jgi:hypothetical protein
MTNDILVFAVAGPLEILIILITLGIPILLIVLLVKYLARGSKERQKLRLELGKLADELEQVRKQAEERKKDEPSTKSE